MTAKWFTGLLEAPYTIWAYTDFNPDVNQAAAGSAPLLRQTLAGPMAKAIPMVPHYSIVWDQ